MAKKPLVDVFTSFFKRGVVSSIWSSSTAYVAGQYAIYQNYIYKCIKNATAGTLPTNTTYWQKTNLGDEITSLNSNLSTFINRTSIVVNKKGTFNTLVQEGSQWAFIMISTDNIVCIFTAQKNDGEVTITEIHKPSDYEIYPDNNGTIDVAYDTTSNFCMGIAFRVA